MSLLLRAMQPGDLDQVVAIDRRCFRPAWPRRSWRHELEATGHSHMVVLSEGVTAGAGGWRGWLRLPGRRQQQGRVLGYGGMWLVGGEGHVCTLATHPERRARGYGELLLSALVRRALARKADTLVLEVRESNRVARELYEKYGFRLFGIKARYYREGNEDACDMRLDLKDEGTLKLLRRRCDAVCARLPHEDRFSLAAPAPGR